MARQGGQEVCTDRRYGSSAQKLVVAVVRLRTSLFAEVPRERAVAGVSREMHQGTHDSESVQQDLPSSSVPGYCHVSARNVPATLAPKLRHPAFQAG